MISRYGVNRMLSEDEIRILNECCKEFGLKPRAVRALLATEQDVYYSNDSQNSIVVNEMIKVMEFWAAQNQESSEPA